MIDFFNTLETIHHISLNQQQKAAVSHCSGPALVLAGPGSGKTTVITARTAYLILEANIPAGRILTLTFNKAAQLEMRNRFQRIFGEDIAGKPVFSTLHSFCYSVVRDYERRQGKRLRLIEGDSGALSENKRQILKELYREINKAALNEEGLEDLINDIGFVKNRMIRIFEGLTFQTRNFESIYKAYENYKKRNLLMDFDDMLTFSYGILRRCPDILSRYQSRYSFFQVDEGQDLSKIQFEILKLLVGSGDGNFFLVADDDQSIYGFRGAEPSQILELENHFINPGLYRLERNYRSSKDLVETTSEFIKSNRQRYDKCHETANPEMLPPQIIRVRDEEEQLAFIEGKIRDHLKAKKDCRIAVLYRNNLSSIALADRLERSSVEFRVKQNRLYFFEHWLVEDILAFLRFSLDPFDKGSFLRIYYKMNRYLSKVMVEAVLNADSQLPVLECILKSCDLKIFQRNGLHALAEEFRRLSKMSPYEALQYIDDEFKYFGSVRDYCDHTGLSFEYLYSMFGILKTLSQPLSGITAFIRRLEELKESFDQSQPFSKENPGGHPSVTLTTLHSSKGLEFDAVFMADLINREIPGDKALSESRKNHDETLMEEERRLFYVGMTRARTWLYLISPETVNGQPEPRSVFVNETARVLNREMKNQIGEGVVILHSKYGKGITSGIKEQSGSTLIEVDFRGLTRTFDLDVCLVNGIISIINNED